MSYSSYLPTRQGDQALWVQNFSTLLNLDPPRYGTTAGDAASVAGLVSAFLAALAIVSDPATKTRTAVTNKNQARVQMFNLIRPLAMQIRENLGVAPADKEALGLKLPDSQPTSVAAPTTMPILELIGATPLEHTLRFNDQNTPNKRAKPPGVIGMQLVKAVGEMPADGPEAAQFVAMVTRQPFAVRFTQADAKKTAYYWARWQTRSGLVGPWSQVASLTVAA